MAWLGCSGGTSARSDAQAGASVPDGQAASDAGAAGAGDTYEGDARATDAYDARDVSPTSPDAGGDGVWTADLSTADRPVNAQPPYSQGAPFGRLQYDLLGKRYGEWVCAVLPQASGQVILVGTANTTWVSYLDEAPANALTLVRLNADGKMDTTFGTAGTTVFDMSPRLFNACRAAAQTKDGKIVVAGDMLASGSKATNSVNHDFVVARFNQDGTLDKTFGSEGATTTNIHLTPDDSPRDDLVASLVLLDDGRIVVGGSTATAQAGSGLAALARYTADGVLDPSFGAGGTLVLDTAKTNNVAFPGVRSLLAESDGSLWAGLSFTLGWQDARFAITRILPDGTLEPGFATAGTLVQALGVEDGQIELKQLSRDADGKLVALVATQSSRASQAVLYRYTAQGLLDASFGTAGRVAVPTATMGATEALFMVRPAVGSADGSILVGLGETGSASYGLFDLIRFSAQGVYDDAFGELSWSLDSTYVSFITAAGVFDNGDLVVAGHITTKDTSNTDTIVLLLKKNVGP